MPASNRDDRGTAPLMKNPLLVGLAAGLISTLVFVSATTGPAMMRLFLFLITPLALFLAGLGWGWIAAAAGTLASLVLISVIGGPMSAIAFALSQGAPATFLTYLAGLSRQAPDGSTEWYPTGRMVAFAALIAGALALGSLLLLGTDIASIKRAIRPMVETFAKEQLPRLGSPTVLGEADLDHMTELAAYVMPAALGLSSLGALLLNLYFAGRVTLASGQLQRVWPDLASMEFPRWMPAAFAAAIAATFLPGFPGLAGAALAGPMMLAYVLMGLAVIHYVTRGASWRSLALWGLYFALFVLNAGMPLILALVGLFDTIRPLRRPPPAHGGPPPPHT